MYYRIFVALQHWIGDSGGRVVVGVFGINGAVRFGRGGSVFYRVCAERRVGDCTERFLAESIVWNFYQEIGVCQYGGTYGMGWDSHCGSVAW